MNNYQIKIAFDYIDENNVQSVFYLSFVSIGNDENEASQNILNFLINNPETFNINKNGQKITPTQNNMNIVEIIPIG